MGCSLDASDNTHPCAVVNFCDDENKIDRTTVITQRVHSIVIKSECITKHNPYTLLNKMKGLKGIITKTKHDMSEGYDKRVARVEKMMDEEDFEKAASEAESIMNELEPTIPALAKASLFKGMAMMTKAMNEMAESGEKPPMELFETVWRALEFAQQLDPGNDESAS